MSRNYSISINQGENFAQQAIELPEGWPSDYPAVASLFYLFRSHPEEEIAQLVVEAGFHKSNIWLALLSDSTTISIYDFPPEILLALSHTLEIQAALILIQYATQQKIEINIQGSINAQIPPRLIRIISHATTMQHDSAVRIPAQLLSLLALNISEDCNIAVGKSGLSTDIFHARSNNQAFIAFLFQDQDYFDRIKNTELNDQDAVLLALWQYQHTQQRNISHNIRAPLARHYIYATTFAIDEVVTDNLFLPTYKNTAQETVAHCIYLYAHIRCGLPYSINLLDKLIEQCREHKLYYWLAYFLSYGQVIRSYAEDYQRSDDIVRLSEAYRIYKSIHDWACVTRALHSKSTLFSKNLRFSNASKYLEICLGIRLFLQDTLGIARVLNGISYIQSQLENFTAAINYSKQSVTYLKDHKQYEELAFTFSQISWYNFLIDQFDQSVLFGRKTIDTMKDKNIRTLPYRTKPDIHAQLGLAYFFNEDIDQALKHSDYCESHKVDSTATGEILRILLRALINDARGDSHLADISFEYLPELIKDSSDIDPHLELFYNRVLMQRYQKQGVDWRASDIKRNSVKLCKKQGFKNSIDWFT